MGGERNDAVVRWIRLTLQALSRLPFCQESGKMTVGNAARGRVPPPAANSPPRKSATMLSFHPVVRGFCHGPTTFFYYQLVLFALLWLCVMLHGAWPSRGAGPSRGQPTPHKPKRTSLRRVQTLCGPHPQAALRPCEHEATPPAPPPCHPSRSPDSRGRPRTVDTSRHFCPHAVRYRGWVGWGNLRANGHPSGRPWRQLHCPGAAAISGDPRHALHGKRVAPDLWGGP